MVPTIITILIIQGVVFAGFCGYLAEEKSKDGPAWAFLGFLFGPIALLTLVGVPSTRVAADSRPPARTQHLEPRRQQTRETQPPPPRVRPPVRSEASDSDKEWNPTSLHTVRCTKCLEQTVFEFDACPNCGSDLKAATKCNYKNCRAPIAAGEPRHVDDSGLVYCYPSHKNRIDSG
jgi:hypothetical protein